MKETELGSETFWFDRTWDGRYCPKYGPVRLLYPVVGPEVLKVVI
jgi:hypothetical protein